MKLINSNTLGALLLGTALTSAHPGLSPEQKGGAPCPFLSHKQADETNRRLGHGYREGPTRSLALRSGDGGVPEGGFAAVQEDLRTLLTDSQDFWPADFTDRGTPHYGGLFIRLAWHCSGSYRESDGRGGCDGARIRFDPEANWEDNANLDMARMLLEPIKEKYGSALSWGDLIVLSGTTAIEAMGGPSLGFCGGRIDDADGSDSLTLGPSEAQELIGPCLSLTPSRQGNCLSVDDSVLGPTTVGLIYVNPAGPVTAHGDPVASGEDIRQAFLNMGFDDVESVALIGGGHAFGKCHGACDSPPCGDGIGNNTFTSGFEGPWTTTPTVWSNEYFANLFAFDWVNITGPGGQLQWAPFLADGTPAQDTIMLTSDIAMARDEAYIPLSQMYRDDIDTLNTDFAAAWYRLTSQDVGPATRCIGDLVPEPQPFQFTLPPSPTTLPDYIPVRAAIQDILDNDAAQVDALINLAYRCASTYRQTDYAGGCNGARIRFDPELSWESNAGVAEALAVLDPVKAMFDDVSYSDLILLAGVTALETSNSDLELDFCGGGVDAENGDASAALAPRIHATPYLTVSDDFIVKGLTPAQGIALASRQNVTSEWYAGLLAMEDGYSDEELALLETAEFVSSVELFAMDEEMLLSTFASAWTQLTTADRYGGFNENACSGVSTATMENEVMDDADTDDEEMEDTSSGPARRAVAATAATMSLALFL